VRSLHRLRLPAWHPAAGGHEAEARRAVEEREDQGVESARGLRRTCPAWARLSTRLCINATECSMMNSGTKYAGISSSGNVAKGAVLISPGAPVVKAAPAAPRTTATARSSIPSTFQPTNQRLEAKPGRRTRASTIQGAANPIAMSPSPAGRANVPGRIAYAYNTRNPKPAQRQACTAAIKRRSSESTNWRNGRAIRSPAKNNSSGAENPIAMAIGATQTPNRTTLSPTGCDPAGWETSVSDMHVFLLLLAFCKSMVKVAS